MEKQIEIPNTDAFMCFIVDGKKIYLTGKHVTDIIKERLVDFVSLNGETAFPDYKKQTA